MWQLTLGCLWACRRKIEMASGMIFISNVSYVSKVFKSISVYSVHYLCNSTNIIKYSLPNWYINCCLCVCWHVLQHAINLFQPALLRIYAGLLIVKTYKLTHKGKIGMKTCHFLLLKSCDSIIQVQYVCMALIIPSDYYKHLQYNW